MKLDVTPEELLALHDMLVPVVHALDEQAYLYDLAAKVRETIIEAIRTQGSYEKLLQYEVWKRTQQEKIDRVDEHAPPEDLGF